MSYLMVAWRAKWLTVAHHWCGVVRLALCLLGPAFQPLYVTKTMRTRIECSRVIIECLFRNRLVEVELAVGRQMTNTIDVLSTTRCEWTVKFSVDNLLTN
jgi:hypothetical protein